MDAPRSYEEILKYIVYKCRENNQPVADSIVAYLLNIMYNEGKNILTIRGG
jgi:hypothetical protein